MHRFGLIHSVHGCLCIVQPPVECDRLGPLLACTMHNIKILVILCVDGTVVCSGGGSVVQPRRDPLPAIAVDICEGE